MVAGALGLAAGQVVAVVISPQAAPLNAVGETFIDHTPLWLKDFAVATFGTHDKTVLTIGMVVVVGLLLAGVGLLARTRRTAGYVAYGVLAFVAAGAALTRPDAQFIDWGPGLACGLVAMLALRPMLDRLPMTARSGSGDDLSRRGFLTAVGITTGLAALAWAGSRVLAGPSRVVAAARSALKVPVPAVSAPPAPAGVNPKVPGLTPYRTSAADFYRIDTALAVPQVDPSTWQLRVYGEVEHEVKLTFDELLKSRLVEAWVTLTCVSNEVGGGLAGNATWIGLPIREVLARAVPKPGADMVLSRSVDGFTASSPLEVLTDPNRNALLAVAMNGQPLPVEHGFPVRMVVPGLYGYVSATKWVTELQVTRFADQTAYWTTRGWSALGPVKTASRIDVPSYGASLKPGLVAVAGVAWAQHRGIEKVEVQVDDAPWQPAQLAPTVGPDTWRQWTFRWQATRGDHRLRVRATDSTGHTQTSVEAPPPPDGATGWHTVTVTVD